MSKCLSLTLGKKKVGFTSLKNFGILNQAWHNTNQFPDKQKSYSSAQKNLEDKIESGN